MTQEFCIHSHLSPRGPFRHGNPPRGLVWDRGYRAARRGDIGT